MTLGKSLAESLGEASAECLGETLPKSGYNGVGEMP